MKVCLLRLPYFTIISFITQQVQKLWEAGIIEPLCGLLTKPDAKVGLVIIRINVCDIKSLLFLSLCRV